MTLGQIATSVAACVALDSPGRGVAMERASQCSAVVESVGSWELRCRVCGSDGLVPIGQVRGFDFWECSRCEFTFTPRVARRARLALGAHAVDPNPDDAFLERALNRLQSGPLRILDFGGGPESLAEGLRGEGHRVITVDTSRPDRPHIDRLTGNLLRLQFPSALFDLAYAYDEFERLPEPMPYLAELLRITRPGGIIAIRAFLDEPDRWGHATPPLQCSFYRLRTFQRALRGSSHAIVWSDEHCVLIERGGARPAQIHAGV